MSEDNTERGEGAMLLLRFFHKPKSLNTFYGYRAIGKGRIAKYVTHEGKAFQKTIREEAIKQNAKPLSGALRVNIALLYNAKKPVLKKYKERMHDVDDQAKALLDALNGVAWHDDSQIVSLQISKHYHPGKDTIGVTAWQV